MTDSEEKAKATKNEKIFKEYFESKFGSSSLGGKKNYKDKDKDVSISVDQSFIANNRTVLIEIDSGNMAKLLVGQYLLINELSKLAPENTAFVVVHFYKDYNPERTKKNLDLVSNNLYEGKAIPHYSLTFEQFKEVCENCNDTAALELTLTNSPHCVDERSAVV
jgi:hypothetical protein